MKSIVDKLIVKYKSKPAHNDSDISDSDLLTLIKAARLAPSADNSQIWRFLIVRDRERIEDVLKIIGHNERNYGAMIISLAAPFFIRHARREQPFYAIDVPISITHICLQAIELNIDVDIHFVFENEELKDRLNIPAEFKSVAVLGLNKYAD